MFLLREKAGSYRFSPSAVSGFLDKHPVVLLGSESPTPQGWEQASALFQTVVWSEGYLHASMGCCSV